jgi:hypothetical protein
MIGWHIEMGKLLNKLMERIQLIDQRLKYSPDDRLEHFDFIKEELAHTSTIL